MKLGREDFEDIILLLASATWEQWESNILRDYLIEKLKKEIEE